MSFSEIDQPVVISICIVYRSAFCLNVLERLQPTKNINLFMIDLHKEGLISFKEELESKYQNVKIVTKKLDLTSLMNQTAFDELDQELA